MEGKGEKPLPQEKAPKAGSNNKMIAVVIVVILLVAAVAGALLLTGSQNKEPTASFTASASEINVGDSVTFNATGSSDPDGTISNYTWYFGDGAVAVNGNMVVSHTFAFSGDYLAVLVVTDDKGASAGTWLTAKRVLVVSNAISGANNNTAPSAVIATDQTVIVSGEKVTANGEGSAAYEMVYTASAWNYTTEPAHRGLWSADFSSDYLNDTSGLSWEFSDDGSTSVGNITSVGIVNHTFAGAGQVCQIWLTTKSIHGPTNKAGRTVVVLPAGLSPTSGVKFPDIFTEVTTGDAESLDPAYDYESAGGEILQNVYETLVWFDGTDPNTLKPMLATNVPTIANGGVTSDGKNYTYNLRANVHFHDGTIMDAQDVIYSIKRVLISNNIYSPAWMLGQLLIPDYSNYDFSPHFSANPIPEALMNASMTASADNMSVTFHLLNAYPAFNQVMAYTVASVVSKEYVELHGGSPVLGRNNWMNDHEAGTGAFKLATFVRGQFIKLERFDNYWQGQARLKVVIVQKVESVATREMMIASGDADCVYIPRRNINDVIGNPDYRIGRGNGTFNLDFIGFNLDIKPGLDSGNITSWFLTDVNVRLAFAHAFNYTDYLTNVLKGTAIEPNGPIPKGMFGYNESIAPYDFNLTKAAEYLKLAIDNRTGNSYANEGFQLKLYYNLGNDDRELACKNFKDNLERLTSLHLVNGTITVQYQGQDWASTYLPNQRNGKLAIFFLGWAPDYNDPDDYALPFLHSVMGTYPTTIGLVNLTLDQMIVDAAHELNLTQRAQMYSAITQACQDNAYYVWLAQATNFHVERTWVHGYYFNPMFSGLYFFPQYKSAVA